MRKAALFLFIFLIPIVSGIGISPPEHELNFQPGLEKEIRYTLVNTQNTPIEAKINVSGKLAPYIEVDQEFIQVKPASARSINLKLSLPEELDPGWNIAKIEFLDNTQRGGGMFGVKVAVVGKLKVFVPYPDLYADTKLRVSNINMGEDIRYKVEIANRGEQDIKNSRLSLKILYNGVEKKEITFKDIDVKSLEEHVIEDSFSSEGLKKGIYTAKGVYDYGKIQEFNKTFNIGSFEIFLVNHSENLYAGQVTPLDVTVRSNWNGEIKGAYVTVKINKTTHRSLEKNLLAFEEKTFKPYIDDESFKAGNDYKANITIHYGNHNTSEIVTLKAMNKQEQIQEQPGVALPPILTSTTTYLVLLVLLLIVMNVILLWRKK